jgi:hypothetical protein
MMTQKEVDACPHPEDEIVPTGGWVDGVEGRKSTVILDLVEGLDPDGREVPVGYE